MARCGCGVFVSLVVVFGVRVRGVVGGVVWWFERRVSPPLPLPPLFPLNNNQYSSAIYDILLCREVWVGIVEYG